MIEAGLVVVLTCLIFLGAFQVSQIFAAKQVLIHAAARGVRAETVGFNHWMVSKVVRVAAIPNAGRMIVPDFDEDNPELTSAMETMRPGDFWTYVLGAAPSSAQSELEIARIPEYLDSANYARGGYILDYANWDSIHFDTSQQGGGTAPMIHMVVHQIYTNWVPMHRAFYAADTIHLSATNVIENHYSLYIDEYDWER